MKLTDTTLRDFDIDSLTAFFSLSTEIGKSALKARLSSPTSDPVELNKRQAQLTDLRTRCRAHQGSIAEARAVLKECEADVVSVGAATSDKRLMEYYTQILWATDSMAASLNHMGWLTELVVLFRTILLPGLTVILPLFILVAPFLLYNFILKQELSVSGYFDLLQTSVKKAMPSVLGAPRFAGKGGLLELGEQFAHVAVAFVMFGFSAWSQISSALSMRGIVADMRRRADSVKKFTQAVMSLRTLLGHNINLKPYAWSDGSLGLFGDAWNDPGRIHRLISEAGELDMLIGIASQKFICFPTYNSSGLHIQDIYHPGLEKSHRVHNTIIMNDTTRKHILLTGPNRGGKSTLLKSLGTAVLMSQTIGIVFARKASLPIFESIVTALSPADTLGKLSLFEAEIEFAKDVKAQASTLSSPMFLMMDEIFHGTNAHDGVEASQVFLDELYTMKAPIYSIVSTHYISLPDRYGSTLSQNLCMEASIDPVDADRLVYTYRIRAGKNGYSSVREILRERGLLVSTKAVVRPGSQKKVEGSQ
jgi:energy-coupling factor transporter ATP-binding protein EcfA2